MLKKSSAFLYIYLYKFTYKKGTISFVVFKMITGCTFLWVGDIKIAFTPVHLNKIYIFDSDLFLYTRNL